MTWGKPMSAASRRAFGQLGRRIGFGIRGDEPGAVAEGAGRRPPEEGRITPPEKATTTRSSPRRISTSFSRFVGRAGSICQPLGER
jgi:hypothetical protein